MSMSEKESFREGIIEDIWVWVGLTILLALTLGASYARWGTLSTALSFLISALKTLLIAYFYMHLKREKGMTRIFALAGAAWLVVLFSLTLSDYVSRGWLPFPTRWPVLMKLKPALNEHYGADEKPAPRPGEFGIGR